MESNKDNIIDYKLLDLSQKPDNSKELLLKTEDWMELYLKPNQEIISLSKLEEENQFLKNKYLELQKDVLNLKRVLIENHGHMPNFNGFYS